MKEKKQKIIKICAGLFIALCTIFSFLWFFFLQYIAYTDDAYVQGNLVRLTPLREGFVKTIFTDDSYLVKKGDLLVELDATDAIISLDRAKENLALKVREVCGSFHEVFARRSEVKSVKAEFIKTAQDYEHRALVVAEEAVSLEDFEHAEAALRSTFFKLQQTEALFEKALAKVEGKTLKNHPETLLACDQARQAWVDLHRCKLYAPVEGLVAQRNIQVGMWVPSGYPSMAIIPLDQIWVNANFKETQMKHMKIGQPVCITSDLYGSDVVFYGKIAGLPGGAGNAFSILPPQNLSGNWIKIVQRLPVRIELDPKQLQKHPLRVGLSLEVTVDLKKEGPLVPSSREGSPLYTTDIFRLEEEGDLRWIEEIIQTNLDPSLSRFKDSPLRRDDRCLQ
jgi:membrane fusion protein, multidrug efflux system